MSQAGLDTRDSVSSSVNGGLSEDVHVSLYVLRGTQYLDRRIEISEEVLKTRGVPLWSLRLHVFPVLVLLIIVSKYIASLSLG